jgi:hypothetical protein
MERPNKDNYPDGELPVSGTETMIVPNATYIHLMDEYADKLEEGIEILKELCQLKSYKDEVGKDGHYEKRQPELWKMANQFLNEISK